MSLILDLCEISYIPISPVKISTSPPTTKHITLDLLVSSLSQCIPLGTFSENNMFLTILHSILVIMSILHLFLPIYLIENSERHRHILRRRALLVVLIKWIDPQGTEVNNEAFAEWLLSGNTEDGNFNQRQITCRLEPFLPVFMKSGGYVNFIDKRKKTLLHYCISYMKDSTDVTKTEKLGDKNLVTALCKRRASIIADDCEGNSPLGLALMKKRTDVVDVLLHKFRISKTTCNRLGQTILHILIDNYNSGSNDYQTYLKLIKYLINQGEDLNEQDKDGLTPVHLAAQSLDLKLLKLFNERKADLHSRTNVRDDLLILACKNLFQLSDQGKTCNLINWLLDKGFKVNSINKYNFSPIHYASQSNHLTVIKGLVAGGANIHDVANDNTNPLHSAATSASFEVLQYFVKSGVDWYRRDKFYGFSLIHMSAFSYNDKNLNYLFGKGFDQNDRGNCDLTPLQLAAMVGNVQVVKLLIKLGANVHYKEKTFGCTALHLASMGGNFASFIQQINLTKLNGKRINKNTSFVSHCFHKFKYTADSKFNYKATIAVLLESGAEVNLRDNLGRTPLHYATQQSITNLVENLLIPGAYIDIKDAKGYTPLHNCLLSANVEELQSLLMFGADFNDIENLSEDIYEKIRMSENTTDHYVLKHLIKLNVAGLHINDIYKSYLSYFEIEDYQIRCLDELSKIKEYMLTPGLSLYNLLQANLHFKHRAKLADSLPCNIEIKFPCYYVLIKGRCNEGVNQMSLIESAKTAFRSLTGLHWPNLCSEYILSFLDNNVLRNLVASVEINCSH